MPIDKVKIAHTRFGDVQYCVEGIGLPVIVSHGSGGGYDQGLFLARRFFPDNKIIAVSRFGYLKSDLPKEPTNKNQAEVFKAVMEQEKIDSAYIAGLSSGGPSAIEFAIKFPKECKGLIMICAVSVPTLKRGVKVNALLKLMVRKDYLYDLVTFIFKNILTQMFGMSKKLVDRLTEEEKEFMTAIIEVTKPVSQRYKGIVNDWNLPRINEEEFGNIKTKTLVIHSIDDKLVSLEDALYTAETIKGADKLIFEDGGHLMFTNHSTIRQKNKSFIV